MSEHPTTEELSAHVDGREPEWAAHLEGCPLCRVTVDALRSIRAAVAAPPSPLDDSAREGVIARAVAAVAAVDSGAADRAPVFDLDEARRRRRAAVVAVGSVAAVLFIVLAAVAVVRSGDGARQTTVAGPRIEADGGAGTAAQVPVQVRNGGDLGDIADPTDLADRVAIGNPRSSANAGPTSDLSQDKSVAADAAIGSAASGSAQATPGAPTSATESHSGAPPQAVEVGTRPCEIEVRLLNQTLGPLLYFATARWQGTPAVVLGFSPNPAAPGQGPVTSPQNLYVAAQDGCHLLGQATTP